MSVGSASEAGLGAGVEEAAPQNLAECGQRVEIGVVAARITGQTDIEGMVKIVAPLRGQPVSAGLSRVVIRRGSFRSDSAMSGMGRPRNVLRRRTSMANSSSMCVRSGVDQCVYGVEPQTVDVIVGQEHQGVVDDVVAYLVGLLTVQVRRLTPDVGPASLRRYGPNSGR